MVSRILILYLLFQSFFISSSCQGSQTNCGEEFYAVLTEYAILYSEYKKDQDYDSVLVDFEKNKLIPTLNQLQKYFQKEYCDSLSNVYIDVLMETYLSANELLFCCLGTLFINHPKEVSEILREKSASVIINDFLEFGYLCAKTTDLNQHQTKELELIINNLKSEFLLDK